MGQEVRIESETNKQIKWIKSLLKRKNRWKERRFIIEGIRSVEQLIENSYNIDTILYSDALGESERGLSLLKLARDRGYKVIRTTDSIFRAIADTEEPQWIMTIAEFKFEKIEDIRPKNNAFFVLLDRVQDPGNMGTIMRTAEAFGADGLILTDGCVDIYNSKTVRSSMGSILQIPVIYFKEIKDAIEQLKRYSVQVVSSSPTAEKNIYDIDLTGSIALVVGNEGSGISDQVLDMSDKKIKIPMVGKAESLNAGVASGILMYEVLRQRIE